MRHYLVVDDNKAFAENLSDILVDGGAQVTMTTSSADALELASRQRFDALLSDMRMPTMGGAELVRRVREVDAGLPAIVITAYTTDDDLTAARAEGLLAVLPKPVPLTTLRQLLKVARRNGLVALVEDDLALAHNVAEALRDRGFSTVSAASVPETEQLHSVTPFVAIVDMRIPGGADGDAMVRLSRRFPTMPMFVVSGFPDVEPPLAAHGYFPKPFSTQLLMEAVERQYLATAA